MQSSKYKQGMAGVKSRNHDIKASAERASRKLAPVVEREVQVAAGLIYRDGKVYPDQQIQLVELSSLEMDMEYQRDTDLKRVARMKSNFNPHKLGVISIGRTIVGGREQLRVDDGKHRCTLLIQQGATHILADIADRTYKESAKFFAEQSLDSSRVSSYQKYKAERESGDAVVLAIDDACEQAGFYVRGTSRKANILTTKHVSGLFVVYKLYGEVHLTKTLRFISEVWPDNQTAVTMQSIVGVAEFLAKVKGYNAKQLKVKLSHQNPQNLKWTYDNAVTKRGLQAQDPQVRTTFANCLINIYNTGRNTGKLERLS